VHCHRRPTPPPGHPWQHPRGGRVGEWAGAARDLGGGRP
jgi:hypothetical protein